MDSRDPLGQPCFLNDFTGKLGAFKEEVVFFVSDNKIREFYFYLLKNCQTNMSKRKRTEIEILLSDSAPPRKPKQTRKIEKESEQKQFENKLENLIVDNWKLVPDGALHSKGAPTKIGSANYRVVGRNLRHSDFFSLFFGDEFWKLWKNVVDNQFLITLSKNQITGKRRKYYKPVSLAQLKIFYGMYLELETNFSSKNNSIEKWFQETRKTKKLEIGENRFFAILSCSQPTSSQFESLEKLFNDTFTGCWDAGSIVAHDETVFSYQPAKNTKKAAEEGLDPIPLVFIPRKPHPNGLLSYLTCGRSGQTDLVYVLRIQPFYKHPQFSARDSLRTTIETWPYDTIPHFVCDAAFGHEEIFQLPKPFMATFSMSTNVLPDVWNVLKYGLQLNHWRAIMRNSVIASVFAATDAEETSFRYHHLLTNAYSVQHTQLSQNNQQLSQESQVQVCQVSQVSQESEEQIPQIPVREYTLDFLNKFKKSELQDLCKKNSMKTVGNKPELITRLLKKLGKAPSRDLYLRQSLSQFESVQWKTNDTHHQFYKDNFNLVDRFNRQWYSFEFGYKVKQWRAKLFFSLSKIALINAWVVANEQKTVDYLTFREQIVVNLRQTAK